MATGTLQVLNQRPQSKNQRAGQRRSERDNPYNGVVWGQSGWPDDTAATLDLTAEALGGAYPGPFVNLAALIADGTYGDGNLAYNAGGDFTAGQYVVLRDGSLAHYDTSAWVVGAA